MMRMGRAWMSVAAVLTCAGTALGQQVHRNGFESGKTWWVKAGADTVYDEVGHASSDQGAHDGQRAEYLQVNANQGTYIHYRYEVGKAPIGAELIGKVWIKANRPGIQLLARVILPNERDPNNLENRMATTIRGEPYRNVGRWQSIDIGRPTQLLKHQQQLLQAQLKRPVNISDAYVDSLMLNVYAGPGVTELWIDDVEIGPMALGPAALGPAALDPRYQPAVRTDATNVPAKVTNIPRAASRAPVVEFNANQLLVGGRRFLMSGINYTNTPLRTLHQAGFNTVFVDYTTQPAVLKEAADLGLWLAPRLRVLSDDAKLASSDGITREIGRYADSDTVLLYHLGGTFTFEHAAPIGRAAQVVRSTDPGRPVGAEVWDGMLPYSRNLNMMGVHRWPLMTTLELPRYRQWLEMRRNLANPDAYLWTWIQNHMPDWHTRIIYERDGAADFQEPVGPQAEQVRLLTYTALAAGVRGLGFWSDRWLADSHLGRDRLLECALLNQELEMIEPLLLTARDPQWIGTSSPDVQAAVMPTSKGILVLPIWQGKGAQFVPGQSAVSKLTMVVPQVPQSMQCWEVSPGEVRGIKSERVPGGTKITVPEFGLTTALVFTADTQQVVRFQEMSRTRRQLAAQWTYDMALYELEKVVAVERQLEQQSHTLPDAVALINDAQGRLQTAKKLWDNRLFSEAYREAQRALRPVRILMRAQWDAAVKELDTPVATPYAVTFFTLPRHWQFMEQVKRHVTTANVLPGGDFEIVPQRKQEAWRLEEPTLDDVVLRADRVGEVEAPNVSKKDAKDARGKAGAKSGPGKGGPATRKDIPHEGKQCAMLRVTPKNPKAPPQALERTLLAITSPPAQLQPGTLVQITAWVCVPTPITASADGALFYDNIGGEPLAVRISEPTPWKKFTLYRRVPASGTVQVTLALTGLGTVYFDDVRIEPLVPGVGSSARASE
ncbi:MAG: hypothetical protein L0Y71_13865 [Gemmataceae bacterium]|nr:hypothetical protein [Gemmataceae bacterium]